MAALLRRPNFSMSSEADMDRPFIDQMKARHPGLDRSTSTPELIDGEEVPDRWIHVVILRGVQILMAAQGYQVLLVGGLETPFIAVHRNLEPLAARTIPPDIEVLFSPELSQDECESITKAIDDGVSTSLSIVGEAAKNAPISGDVFAERIWRTCRVRCTNIPTPTARSEVDERRVGEYVALFHGQPHLQQLEMALALSERVLTGKDKPDERQIKAAAATQMWRELGDIDLSQSDRLVAARGGGARVASLGSQSERERYEFVDLM
ncbi:MAG: hypothetical protein JNK56_35715, partial [Myxococcales bacterium]|nr:hypothetical protein [Myxococcales bacterium]